MKRKLSAFILLSASASAALAQQTVEPRSGQTTRSITRTILVDRFGGSYLGVQTLEITKENFGRYGLREVRGVAVETVAKDSPAERAGLQNGDVIVKYNGEEVTGVSKLTRLINETAPDHQARITVLRGGGESELTATLGKRQPPVFPNGGFDMEAPTLDGFNLPGAPMPPAMSFPLPDDSNVFVFRTGANRQIGVGVAPLNKQLADFFGVASGEGLLVNNVRENTPAARAGIKAGDVIVEADGKAVKNDSDLIRALNDKKDGDIVLTVVRDKNRQTISVTPEVSKAAPAQFRGFENFNQPDGFRPQAPAMPAAPAPPVQPVKSLRRVL